MPADPLQELTAQRGRYRLDAQLARDALVVEHAATIIDRLDTNGLPGASGSASSSQLRPGDPVVIKILSSPAIHRDGIANHFVREAARRSTLEHRNLRAFHDFGCQGDALFVCTEPLAGQTAFSLSRSHGPRRPDRRWSTYAAHIIADACRALESAHGLESESRGNLQPMIHGGISPHTIAIGNDGIVRLDDFAFARAQARVRNAVSIDASHTLPYLAPEQLGRDHALTQRVDIWSLGVCLWEMLTGRSLFRGDSDAATLLALTVGPLAAPSQLEPSVPVELDRIVSRCIARNPAERYTSAAELSKALRGFLGRRIDRVGRTELAALARQRNHRISGASFQRPAVALGFDRDGQESGETTMRALQGASLPRLRKRREGTMLSLLSLLLVAVVIAGAWLWHHRQDDSPLYTVQSTAAGATGAAATNRAPPTGARPPINNENRAAEAAEGDDGDNAKLIRRRARAKERAKRRSATSRRERKSRSRRSRKRSSPTPTEGSERALADAVPAGGEAAPSPTADASSEPRAIAVAPVPTARISEPSSPMPEPRPRRPKKARDLAPGKAKNAKITISSLKVQGGVPTQEVKRALNRVRGGFRNCYVDASQKAGSSPRGAMTMQLVIDESNRANVSEVSDSLLPGMSSCLTRAASRLQNRTPPDVGVVRVSFDIGFKPMFE